MEVILQHMAGGSDIKDWHSAVQNPVECMDREEAISEGLLECKVYNYTGTLKLFLLILFILFIGVLLFYSSLIFAQSCAS
jgi:hypothetical protein